jgi:hypothetical protein
MTSDETLVAVPGRRRAGLRKAANLSSAPSSRAAAKSPSRLGDQVRIAANRGTPWALSEHGADVTFTELEMAKRRKYSKGASREVKNEMHRYKRGTAKSGRGGRGGRVKSRKQAIAIALSKARKKGKKVPRKKR